MFEILLSLVFLLLRQLNNRSTPHSIFLKYRTILVPVLTPSKYPRASTYFMFLDVAVITVAQPVKRPEWRSLKEVQLSQLELDSQSRHGSLGKIPATPFVGVGGKTLALKSKFKDWARRQKCCGVSCPTLYIPPITNNPRLFKSGTIQLLVFIQDTFLAEFEREPSWWWGKCSTAELERQDNATAIEPWTSRLTSRLNDLNDLSHPIG